VQSRVRQAVSLTERYGIDGVPAVVINGKYPDFGSLTGSFANLLRVIDTLVAQERAALSGGAPANRHQPLNPAHRDPRHPGRTPAPRTAGP